MRILLRQGLLLLPVVLAAGIADALINGVSVEHASAILIGTLLAWIWPWWP